MSARLIVIILEREKALETILDSLYKLGVRATVLQSQGMQRTLLEDIPLFGGLAGAGQVQSHHRTLLSVVEGKELFEKVVELVREACAEYEGERTGIIFSLPIDFYLHL